MQRYAMVYDPKDDMNEMLPSNIGGWVRRADAQAEIARLTRERDEALAKVEKLVKDQRGLAQIITQSITPNDADVHRLLLDGEYHTGPVVDWVHRIMTTMHALLDKQDDPVANAALNRVRAGAMREAADLFRDANHGQHIMSVILAQADAVERGE